MAHRRREQPNQLLGFSLRSLTRMCFFRRRVLVRLFFLTDTNCDVYPVREGQRLTFVLASTLDLSGKPDDGTYKPLGDEVRKRNPDVKHNYGEKGGV